MIKKIVMTNLFYESVLRKNYYEYSEKKKCGCTYEQGDFGATHIVTCLMRGDNKPVYDVIKTEAEAGTVAREARAAMEAGELE